MKTIIDAVYEDPEIEIQIKRSYGYARYVHDEENGDTRIGPYRFRRLGGYDGPPWQNVLVDNNHIEEIVNC